MRFSNLSNLTAAFAAVLLLTACSTTPETTLDAGGTGTSTTTTDTTGVAGPTPGSDEDFVVNVGDRVFFDYDQYDLRPDARAQLDKQVAWLKTYPQWVLTIEGHCDERGTREYNLALGERRANAVHNYLVAQGIDPNRMSTISYGKERPVVPCSDESCWSQNRRGVIVLTQ
jgi:peptidoglycan-associated lipoprotein